METMITQRVAAIGRLIDSVGRLAGWAGVDLADMIEWGYLAESDLELETYVEDGK